MSESPFDSVESAIEAIAEGKIVIVTDDEERENEGDLVMAASRVTPEAVNMMIRHARGLICVPTTSYQLRRLGINQMVVDNRESHQTDFSVSVDAAESITTGISAYDRSRTIRLLADPDTGPDQLVQPGHVFPLRAKPGGVLQRAGHTEASVDLASLAGLHPSGVICEILKEDGSMARLGDLVAFKKQFDLRMISIAALIEYRHKREKLVEQIHTRPFESDFGTFALHLFRSRLDDRFHLALTMGELDGSPTLVRVHSENLLSDVFRGNDFGSYPSLVGSLHKIAREGKGVVLYIGQPHHGMNFLLEDSGGGGKPAGMDFRDYGIGAQILVSLGLRKIRLLSSHTRKVVALDGYGLEIVDLVSVS
ncbi:MAG: 3,4-dihydroxy-2-butanone-4-phosphate synthase [Opitutales bacterium]